MSKNRFTSKTGRLYVGVDDESGHWFVFRSTRTPTERTHGNLRERRVCPPFSDEWKSRGVSFRYVIGPFRTLAAAKLMRDYGSNNPHLQHVDDAERAVKAKHREWGESWA